MSVRGLPKGQFRQGGGGGTTSSIGSVEWVNSTGTTGTSPTVSSMDTDEFAIIVAGVSGNSWMRSLGRTSTDLEVSTLCIGHNGDGWESVHVAYVAPLPEFALTHSTSIDWSIGSSDNPAWCRATFRKTDGFKGLLVAAQRYNVGGGNEYFYITPFTNPMTEPGGVCITGAFKDYTNYPTTVGGTGWNAGGWGGLTIQGYYPLSQTEIETPPQMYFYGSTGRAWAGFCLYLR